MPRRAQRRRDEWNPKVVNGERTTLADAIQNMLQTGDNLFLQHRIYLNATLPMQVCDSPVKFSRDYLGNYRQDNTRAIS